ncbi:MAG TPA: MotA/TolQ/ExbB proton channel family protein [Candidatus Dormibacteraeota bacterium]|nr:MotA/TolQ/ExbB proton channel family protein [Candidatus Dormibacteraeota bacterium]
MLLLASPLTGLLEQTGWVARIVLLILLVFSLFSWAVILEKYRFFGQVASHTKNFLKMFRSSRDMPNASTLQAMASGSPLVTVYSAGYEEWIRQSGGGNPHPGPARNTQMIAVEMQLAATEETRRLERWMPFLATTGSVSPFIGLFGTVWGVMDAFSRLGEVGATTLRATAPGIAEALITTAAGLFAAIPAVIAYNHYLHHIRDFSTRMENFITEVVVRIEALSH